METTGRTGSGAPHLREAVRRHDVILAGILSGIVGAIAMVVVGILGAVSEGVALFLPLQVLGETFVGPDALAGGAKVAYGTLVLLVTAVALSLLFVVVAPFDYPMASAMGIGVAFALGAMILLSTFVVPFVNPGLRFALHPIGGTWVVAHVAYGAVIGLVPAFRRWIVRVPGGARPEPRPAGAAGMAPRPRTT